LENGENGAGIFSGSHFGILNGEWLRVSRGDLSWQIWFSTASLIEQVPITTAKQIGVTIAPEVLARADKVIK